MLKGETSTSKRPLKDNSTSTDPKKLKLNGSDDSVEHQNNITIDSQVELLDVDDDKHIFPVRSKHVEKLGNYQFYHKITSDGACLTNSLSGVYILQMTRILFPELTEPAPKIFAIEGNPTPLIKRILLH